MNPSTWSGSIKAGWLVPVRFKARIEKLAFEHHLEMDWSVSHGLSRRTMTFTVRGHHYNVWSFKRYVQSTPCLDSRLESD